MSGEYMESQMQARYDAYDDALKAETARANLYEEILRVVCHHLGLPQSESGPADDLRLYDQALEAADVYTRKADTDLAENTRLRFKAEAEAHRLREALTLAADQLATVHDDAFRQAAGYGLVTSDGRSFSCFELNKCESVAIKVRGVLNISEDV